MLLWADIHCIDILVKSVTTCCKIDKFENEIDPDMRVV